MHQPLRHDLPAFVADMNGSIIYEGLDQLFNVEGITAGMADGHLLQYLGHVYHLPQNVAHELAALGRGERLQWQVGVGGGIFSPVRPALKEFRPGQADDQQWQVSRLPHLVFDPIEGAFVRPVDIFQQDGRRSMAYEDFRRGLRA